MFVRGYVNAMNTSQFRHLCRSLQPGEPLPIRPSLTEQLTAFLADRTRLELETELVLVSSDGWFEEGDDDL